MKPLPHQIEGSRFLAARKFAALGDAPRVGKTGAAIMACDLVLARDVLVVTTASGRPVWRKGVQDWAAFGEAEIMLPKRQYLPDTRFVITGWPNISEAKLRRKLLARRWDVVVFDESHYAKNFEAKRTQAAYGIPSPSGLRTDYALAGVGQRLWNLSGTLMPNSPLDLFPMLLFGAPERLTAHPAKGWPDVTDETAFRDRYCEWRPKKIGHGSYARTVIVIIKGKNLPELRERISGLILRRTQEDVGILPPIYETLPLLVPEKARREADKVANVKAVLAAIDAGNTKDLDMHLGPLKRLTGTLKAKAVIDLVRDEFAGGLDKIVLAFWHREVAEILAEGLGKFGVTGIDGATLTNRREENVAAFKRPDGPRVFLAQIQAAGEAIDLSSAAELIFVEMSSVPKDGAQMALRITNHSQARRPRVRVGTVAGSIDEPIQEALLRKVQTINEVMK